MAVLKIPIELEQMYDSDPEVFLRDIANFPQEAILRYFKTVKNISRCVKRGRKNPFDFNTHQFDKGFKCTSPYARYMHFDLSLGGDLCAFAMGHSPSFVEVNRIMNGKLVSDQMPYVVFDFVGVMLVERDQEVWLPKIPELIMELSYYGFPINLITFDNWQSAYIIQLLKDRGFLTEVLSIDRTSNKIIIDLDKKDYPVRRESTKGNYLAAMSSLKDSVNQSRIDIPYHPAIRMRTAESQFEVEAKAAQYFPDKQKVDHGSGGTIDLLQAIAGVVFNIENNEKASFIDPKALEGAQDPYYNTLDRSSLGFEETTSFEKGGDRNVSYLG